MSTGACDGCWWLGAACPCRECSECGERSEASLETLDYGDTDDEGFPIQAYRPCGDCSRAVAS